MKISYIKMKCEYGPTILKKNLKKCQLLIFGQIFFKFSLIRFMNSNHLNSYKKSFESFEYILDHTINNFSQWSFKKRKTTKKYQIKTDD